MRSIHVHETEPNNFTVIMGEAFARNLTPDEAAFVVSGFFHNVEQLRFLRTVEDEAKFLRQLARNRADRDGERAAEAAQCDSESENPTTGC